MQHDVAARPKLNKPEAGDRSVLSTTEVSEGARVLVLSRSKSVASAYEDLSRWVFTQRIYRFVSIRRGREPLFAAPYEKAAIRSGIGPAVMSTIQGPDEITVRYVRDILLKRA